MWHVLCSSAMCWNVQGKRVSLLVQILRLGAESLVTKVMFHLLFLWSCGPYFTSSSSLFPVLGLLRPVTGVTKLNHSIFSKVFLNFFSLLVGILKSFLGSCERSSCQHALSNVFCTDHIWYTTKGKAVPLHAMEALGGRGGIAPTHSRPRH
jgi:hypothetical protein